MLPAVSYAAEIGDECNIVIKVNIFIIDQKLQAINTKSTSHLPIKCKSSTKTMQIIDLKVQFIYEIIGNNATNQ